MNQTRQDRFFKFDGDEPVEISARDACYDFISGPKDGVTRVEYVDTPERYVIHANSNATSWAWDKLQQMLEDQPEEYP